MDLDPQPRQPTSWSRVGSLLTWKSALFPSKLSVYHPTILPQRVYIDDVCAVFRVFFHLSFPLGLCHGLACTIYPLIHSAVYLLNLLPPPSPIHVSLLLSCILYSVFLDFSSGQLVGMIGSCSQISNEGCGGLAKIDLWLVLVFYWKHLSSCRYSEWKSIKGCKSLRVSPSWQAFCMFHQLVRHVTSYLIRAPATASACAPHLSRFSTVNQVTSTLR